MFLDDDIRKLCIKEFSDSFYAVERGDVRCLTGWLDSKDTQPLFTEIAEEGAVVAAKIDHQSLGWWSQFFHNSLCIAAEMLR